MINKKIGLLLVFVLALKVILLLTWGDFQSMNPDEEGNYLLAANYLEGNDYTRNGKLSAFNGSFTVFLYKYLIINNISKNTYIGIYHFLSILIFILSIPFFYKILLNLKVQSKIAFLSTVLYCIYPSNLFFIGNLFLYEKMVLPLLVIVFYYLLSTIRFNRKERMAWIVPIIVTVSCLFRAQLIFIYFIIFLFFGLYLIITFHKQRNVLKKALLFLFTLIFLVISHIPIFLKNHTMYGSYILSTQTGYELMQGHNELARGSWMGNWTDPESAYYKYSRTIMPEIDSYNQYEEGIARKEYALNWIKNNPLKEIKLIIKKTAIFLMPRNYLAGYNSFNILLHIAFVLSIMLMFLRKNADVNSWLILSPIIGTYLLSLIFFVGIRWRYYAEPFFIIFANYQLIEYAYSRKWFKNIKIK